MGQVLTRPLLERYLLDSAVQGGEKCLRIVQAFIGSGSECLQVLSYCRILVIRSTELKTELINVTVEVVEMNAHNC
jgi:hypothetical protein